MKSLTSAEYLQLLEKLVEQQYGEDYSSSEDIAWTPAEPEIKKKINLLVNQGFIDLSNVKKDKLSDFVFSHRNIIVGPFRISVHEHLVSDAGETFSLTIYEEKMERHLNTNGLMTTKIDVLKDNRFIGRPWLKHFNSFKRGKGIPADTVVDIIRWLQGINKLTAFL